MTLCIAAIARSENKIVAVSDFMLSTDSMSMTSRVSKVAKFGASGKWIEMFSGDPSANQEILVKASGNLGSEEKWVSDEVPDAFASAYRDILKHKIEGEVLSPFGLTRDQFLRDGRAMFGDENFTRIAAQIGSSSLETDILLAGFQENGTPRLASISNPGVKYIHDMASFYAIGCGEQLANAALMSEFDPCARISETIYRILEAKFKSESAPGVGKETSLMLLCPDGNSVRISPEHLEKIRSFWESEGKPTVPNKAIELVRELFAQKVQFAT